MITSGIPGVVAAGTEIELVKEGFVFTEGPVCTPDEGSFSRCEIYPHPDLSCLKMERLRMRKVATFDQIKGGDSVLMYTIISFGDVQ